MFGGGGHFRLSSFAEESRAHYSPQVARRLLAYLTPYKLTLVGGVALMAVAAGLFLLGPYLLKVAIDRYIAAGDWMGLNRIVLLSFGSFALGAIAMGSQIYFVSYVGQEVLARMRQDLFVHLQELSLNYYDEHEGGEIMSRLSSDTDAMSQLLTTGVTVIFSDVLQLLSIVGVMLFLNWKLALLTFTVLPLMGWAMSAFTTAARQAYRRTRRSVGAVSAELAESISMVRVVQSFARERTNLERFDEVNRDNRDAGITAAAVSSAFFPSIDLLGSVATAIVVAVGGTLILGGGLTLGVIVAFMGYVSRFFQPIRDLAQLYNTFQVAMAAGERVFGLLDTPPDIRDAPNAYDLPELKGHVEFKDVKLAYRDGGIVLEGIDLKVQSGQTVALVGPTGAGKTSIVNLIARFYDVTSGQVMLDGHDVRAVTLHSLRKQLGIVPQDSFLFSGTIADNIRYGRLEATAEEVEHAARLVDAHDFISALPNGYGMPVFESGVNLSQGQRQLICLARAILADPRILILDEATSSVDTRTEVLIQNAVDRLLSGRTSFVIAHRLSTIRNAGQVLVVEDGRIVERGTHTELLAARGRYWELYTMQFRLNDHNAAEAVPQTDASDTGTRRQAPAALT